MTAGARESQSEKPGRRDSGSSLTVTSNSKRTRGLTNSPTTITAHFTAQEIREADEAVKPGAARFLSVQNRYSILHREPEDTGVLAECERLGITFLPYFPLESGLLTGKVQQGHAPEGTRLAESGPASRFLTEQNVALAEQLTKFAESRGHSILELAFAWLLAKPVVVSVIAGATKAEQVKANAGAAGWKLTPDDLAAVESIVSQPA